MGTDQPQRSLSVRVRLMLLAVVAILPLLLLGLFNEERDRKERIEAAYQNALDLARQGATAQNEVIVSARSLLRVVASARANFDVSNDDCNKFLARIAEPVPWLKTLSVADLEGRIICSSFPGALGLDISERPYFKTTVEYGGFSISDYFVAERIKAPVITAALAQTGPGGETTAIVVGLLDLSWFENVARTFVPASAAMLMIDGTGTILAQYPNPHDLIGKKLDGHPLVKAMLARPEGFVTEAAPDGVRRIFGYVQLPDTSTRIAVGFAESDVLVRVNRAMWQAFAEVGFVAFLVLLSIWFGGERLLVRPIRALANTATRIGRGDVETHAWQLPWAAEFVPLAAALDDMAAQLHLREQELRDSNAQLRELAEVDGLTGLGNRRAFNNRLAAEWSIAVRLRQPIAILMIDVDHFKSFNDHHGHICGDDCLRKVGGALIEGIRTEVGGSAAGTDAELPPSYGRVGGRARRADFAARYGGEEFSVLLQGADIDIALRVAERLRSTVEKLQIAHSGTATGFVSVSIGAASVLPAQDDPQQQLVERADAALYQAKRLGRNRVVPSVALLSRAS